MLIERIHPEQLVLDQRAAGGEAVDLAQILRLQVLRSVKPGGGVESIDRGVVVECIPLALAVVEVSLAVQLVSTALGDRVDHAAGGAAILRRIDRKSTRL